MLRKTDLFLLLLLSSFSQSLLAQNVSPEEALEQSTQYVQKAKELLEIPQYNYDSAVHYLNKAFVLLDLNEPLHQSAIVKIYQQKFTDFMTVNVDLDSIATAGWIFGNQLPETEENRLLKYRYLMDWSYLRLDNGQIQPGQKLFQDALALTRLNESPEFEANLNLDKGYFYGRFGLDEEIPLARQYQLKALVYYESKDLKEYADEYFRINRMRMALCEKEHHYLKVNKIDSAYYYLFRQARAVPYLKDPRKVATHYAILGREQITFPLSGSFVSEEQYNEGCQNIKKALAVLETYQVKNSLDIYPYCYGLLGDIHRLQGRYDSAVISFTKAYETYLKANKRYSAYAILRVISDTYKGKGDFKKALEYREQFYQESLAFEREKNARSLRESDLQVNVLNQQRELESKATQQKIFIVLLVMGLVLLGLIFYNYWIKQKSSKRLALLNKNLESKNSLLDKRNAENELLLKEIHHRVKNNLEVVSSLLALQSAQIDDKNVKDAMQEGQNRVNSIGIVHQKLYQGENLGSIEMKDYFINLSASIIDTFGAEDRVKLEVAMEKLNVDVDTAVPLGLIVNELLTNTMKYAFPEGIEGHVRIKLEQQPDGILHLEVSDNGTGKSGATQGTGFGSQLINLLTRQLNGVMREENLNGTRLIFDFAIAKA